MVMEFCEFCEMPNQLTEVQPALQYECLLFDLDDTLYPSNTGIAQSCKRNIEEYMMEKMGFDAETSKELCGRFYKEHGTSMAGLVMAGYHIDYDEYHSFVHGRLPYHVLKPDPVLRSLLLSIPQRKLIFTNSDLRHAIKVLRMLGLEDCFEGIICFETINMAYKDLANGKIYNYELDYDLEYPISNAAFMGTKIEASEIEPVICKPSMEAMNRAIALTGADPCKTLFLDDSPRNIAGGKYVGLHTVLVGSSVKVEEADYVIESIHNIREAIPAIWEYEEFVSSTNHLPLETIAIA